MSFAIIKVKCFYYTLEADIAKSVDPDPSPYCDPIALRIAKTMSKLCFSCVPSVNSHLFC